MDLEDEGPTSIISKLQAIQDKISGNRYKGSPLATKEKKRLSKVQTFHKDYILLTSSDDEKDPTNGTNQKTVKVLKRKLAPSNYTDDSDYVPESNTYQANKDGIGPKRGRGRPKKHRVNEEKVHSLLYLSKVLSRAELRKQNDSKDTNTQEACDSDETKIKRGRGRPKRINSVMRAEGDSSSQNCIESRQVTESGQGIFELSTELETEHLLKEAELSSNALEALAFVYQDENKFESDGLRLGLSFGDSTCTSSLILTPPTSAHTTPEKLRSLIAPSLTHAITNNTKDVLANSLKSPTFNSTKQLSENSFKPVTHHFTKNLSTEEKPPVVSLHCMRTRRSTSTVTPKKVSNAKTPVFKEASFPKSKLKSNARPLTNRSLIAIENSNKKLSQPRAIPSEEKPIISHAHSTGTRRRPITPRNTNVHESPTNANSYIEECKHLTIQIHAKTKPFSLKGNADNNESNATTEQSFSPSENANHSESNCITEEYFPPKKDADNSQSNVITEGVFSPKENTNNSQSNAITMQSFPPCETHDISQPNINKFSLDENNDSTEVINENIPSKKNLPEVKAEIVNVANIIEKKGSLPSVEKLNTEEIQDRNVLTNHFHDESDYLSERLTNNCIKSKAPSASNEPTSSNASFPSNATQPLESRDSPLRARGGYRAGHSASTHFPTPAKRQFQVTPDKWFTCEKCGTIFKFLSTYNYHVTTDCNTKTVTVNPDESMEGEESGSGVFQCPQCPKQVASRTSLMVHLRQHTGERPFQCDICPLAFYQKHHLRDHQDKIHLNPKSFRCRSCGETSLGFIAWKSHMSECRQKELKSQSYPCRLCGERYKTREELDGHVITHRGEEKRFSCDLCSRRFHTAQQLSRHHRTCTSPHQSCSLCGKRFSCGRRLRSHRARHEGAGALGFKCSECPARFYTSYELKMHGRLHSDERPFPCPECKKRFRRKATMELHLTLHTGAKPYACTECDQKFNRNIKLQIHCTQAHNKGNMFQCCHCAKSFPCKSYLIPHLRVHTGEKPYVCPLCPMRFLRSYEIRVHLRRNHRGNDRNPYSRAFVSVGETAADNEKETDDLTGNGAQETNDTGSAGLQYVDNQETDKLQEIVAQESSNEMNDHETIAHHGFLEEREILPDIPSVKEEPLYEDRRMSRGKDYEPMDEYERHLFNNQDGGDVNAECQSHQIDGQAPPGQGIPIENGDLTENLVEQISKQEPLQESPCEEYDVPPVKVELLHYIDNTKENNTEDVKEEIDER